MRSKFGLLFLIITSAFFSALLTGCTYIRSDDMNKGTLGENISYEYNSLTKTLKISGSGEMNAPKFFFSDIKINKLTISEGITSISESLFYSNKNLKCEVKFPSTLTDIGEFSFYGCGISGALVFPDSVEKIGQYAFDMCGEITEIEFGKGLKEIGDDAFDRCVKLEKMSLPDGVEILGKSVFNQCGMLKGDLVIPNSVKSIGAYAFAQCGFDGTLTLSNQLEVIPNACFSFSGSFKGDLVIPNSVKKIESQAFSGCGFDGTLSLPNELENIERYAFSSLKSLSGSVEIPESVIKIGESAFSGCSRITSVKLPIGMKYIPQGCFSDCSSLSGELILPETIKVIGDSAFYYCKSLTAVPEFPNGLTSIGKSAFQYCTSISGTPEFPNSLLNIKESAFYGCEQLSGNLKFPENLTYIGKSAFSKCAVESAEFTSGIVAIDKGAFSKCENMKTAVFGDSIPDYYTKDEKDPTFPETLEPSAQPNAVKACDLLKSGNISAQQSAPDQSSFGGMAMKIMPYDWTSELNSENRGCGKYAYASIVFENGKAVAMINGRELCSVPFTADGFNYDNRIVNTKGLNIGNGIVNSFEMLGRGFEDVILGGTIEGTDERVYFIYASEEKVMEIE